MLIRSYLLVSLGISRVSYKNPPFVNFMQKIKRQKLYVIPGWGETAKFKHSKELIDWASKKYEVVPVRYVSKKGVLLNLAKRF